MGKQYYLTLLKSIQIFEHLQEEGPVRCQLQDIGFQVPDHWQDRSITAFAAPLEPGQSVAPNVVVTRDKVGTGQTFRSYADSQIVELTKRLDAFNLISRQEVAIQNLPAVSLFFSWRGQPGTFTQWQVFFPGTNDIVFSAVATALEKDFPRYQQIFGEVFRTIQIPAVTKSSY